MVSMTRSPSSRATIAAGTSPPRVMATTAWNGPSSLSRQVSARQSLWNWSHDTGNGFPALPAVLDAVLDFALDFVPDLAMARFVRDPVTGSPAGLPASPSPQPSRR